MLKLASLLASLLLVSPAFAMNELRGQKVSKVEEASKGHGVVEKLNDADTAAMDARTNPRPRPSEIYLLTVGDGVIILLVHNDVVIFSSDPVELDKINQMLKRTGT